MNDIHFKQVCTLLITLVMVATSILAQETSFVNVHFIHGSKPEKGFMNLEKKWRGGIWGGHVGLEISPDKVIDFKPQGRFHWLLHRKKIHSQFSFHTQEGFWRYFGLAPETLERTTVAIPISPAQKKLLDSLATAYVDQSPYDYAFIGMRCASASYDILMQAGILKKHSWLRCGQQYFYPKKLRKRLLNMAAENDWKVVKNTGNERRKWDKDVR
jgi:hypothetical protein